MGAFNVDGTTALASARGRAGKADAKRIYGTVREHYWESQMNTKVLPDIDKQTEHVPHVRLVGVGEHLIAINECNHAIVLQIGGIGCQPASIPLAAHEKRDIAGEIPERIFEGS